MPRDYKNRANASRSGKRRQVPCWACFSAGLLVGLFFSGLAWLKLLPAPDEAAGPLPAPQQELAEQPQRPAGKKPQPAPDKVPYEFYTILPEMEVVVPEPEPLPPPRPAPRQAGTTQKPAARTAADGARYMLQMGSFRRYGDADRLKASLALVGIRAEIQKVRVGNGETFHRVRSGPYSREKVNQLRARLKQNRINSLVIKLKG